MNDINILDFFKLKSFKISRFELRQLRLKLKYKRKILFEEIIVINERLYVIFKKKFDKDIIEHFDYIIFIFECEFKSIAIRNKKLN